MLVCIFTSVWSDNLLLQGDDCDSILSSTMSKEPGTSQYAFACARKKCYARGVSTYASPYLVPYTKKQATQIYALPVLQDNYIWMLLNPGFCVAIDPALSGPVVQFLLQHNRRLDYILNTHHHHDHVGGNAELKHIYNCKIIGPEYDWHRIPCIDQGVQGGQQLPHLAAKVLFTPGHTSGHVVYYFKQLEAAFCGDTWFSLGCGRLFEGTAEQMWQSLSLIKLLPPATQLYCAHEYTRSNAQFALSLEAHRPPLLDKMQWIQKQHQLGCPTLPARLSDELQLNPFLRADEASLQRKLKLQTHTPEHVFAHLRQLKDSF